MQATLPKSRTVDDVRLESEHHFNYMTEMPRSFLERSPEDCREEARLGRLVVARALALVEDEILELGTAWETEHAPTHAQRRSLSNALFFISGPLKLLEMEFVHAKVGTLPISVVRELLEKRTAEYADVRLTHTNVSVQYRRRAL